jgi:hypothetical protein
MQSIAVSAAIAAFVRRTLASNRLIEGLTAEGKLDSTSTIDKVVLLG